MKKVFLFWPVFIVTIVLVIFLIRPGGEERLPAAEEINNWPGGVMATEEEVSPDFTYLEIIADQKDQLIDQKKDFIEVNLEEETVRLYRSGQIIKSFAFLVAGDADNWGGSAAGLYHVRSKNRISYSVSSGLYMPYALHYYGKYYIHGEPYYPAGRKFTAEFSGGCIGLSNQDAQDLYNEAEIGLPVLVIDRSRAKHVYQNQNISDFPEITAASYLVADLDSGQILAEFNSQEIRPIASVTKLMTATVVAETVNLSKSITVDPSMLIAYGSVERVEPGQTLNVVELFYPLLVESSNNAGEVLSHFLGRDRTINLMNQKAASLLMPDTYFIDPHGLSPENVSTASDLFQLTRYIFYNRPPLLRISRGELVHPLSQFQLEIDQLWNKNTFAHDPNFIGGKSGFIKLSRHTGTMLFQFVDGSGEIRNIAIIYLGSENPKSEVQRIYAWLRQNFSLDPVF
ncbi:MAG TPA: L,D-transpeptidase family protein [Candidatus Pacearchaeota archaeon]|nr:L,D-transpeptidase family protein [Candidatus Pacearchaeota archaeon]